MCFHNYKVTKCKKCDHRIDSEFWVEECDVYNRNTGVDCKQTPVFEEKKVDSSECPECISEEPVKDDIKE